MIKKEVSKLFNVSRRDDNDDYDDNDDDDDNDDSQNDDLGESV